MSIRIGESGAVEKTFRRAQDPTQAPSSDEALTAKLSILNEMIVQDILLAKARALKIEVPDSELDAKYAEAKKNLSEEAYQQELSKRNLTGADMREGLRRELVANKLIEQEVTSKVVVSDQEITDFFNANRAQFNLAEDSYHIGQYCARGDSENRLKELKHALALGRTSCTRFWANQLRVTLTAAAFVLLQELQLRADRTALRGAQVPRLRQALITIGVQVVRSVRRIVLHFLQSHPDAAAWTRLARALGAAPA